MINFGLQLKGFLDDDHDHDQHHLFQIAIRRQYITYNLHHNGLLQEILNVDICNI